MGSSSVNEESTSGETNKSDNEREVGLEQFPDFPGQLVSYPPGSNAYKEFCKAKVAVGGKWGKCVEFAGRQFRGCIVVEGEEYFFLLANLEVEKRDRGIYESISLENFDVDAQSDLSEGFLCYLSQLEYGLSLPLTNLAKGIMNAIGACLVQLNGNISAQPHPVKPCKVALKYQKKWMLKALLASGTTGSGEVAKEKRRKVEPSGESGEMVVEGRSAMVDDLKEVEERAMLAVLQGGEDMSKIVARLVKGIWLGIEEEKTELKKANVKLEKELARSRTDALKEVRQLTASHAVTIDQLQVESKANFDEMVEERDRLGHYLMLKGYFEEEVDAIKADTYVEEEDEKKTKAVGIMEGLDGVSC
ncbi:hypothetical protein GIB67_031720 [Kingdonia uniflora]|uniref:Uncharacterized protein n=1 Tax=Kingdonia uniflora TaxID=39325 RepID=A0A7J7NJW6_9MAGN|nr:hypothetical protein GIB67_031720 [Kingdonia uniflora]